MSVIVDRTRAAVAAAAVATGLVATGLVATGLGGEASAALPPAADDGIALAVVDQTFAVADGEPLRLTLRLTASDADLARIDAAAATTSTSIPPATELPAATAAAPTEAPPTTTAAAVAAPTSPTSPTTVAEADGVSRPATAGPAETTDGIVVVTLHEPLADTGELAELERDGPGRAVDSATVALADVLEASDAGAAAGVVSLPIVLTDDEASLVADVAGIHPVSVEVRVGGVVVATASTFVLVVDPSDEPAAAYPIAVLASIADPGPWADPDVVAATQADLARLIDLAAATDAPLTISIPPSVARPPAAPLDPAAPGGTGAPEATGAEAADTARSSGPEPSEASADSAAVVDDTDPATSEPISAAERLADQIVGDELLGRPLVPLDPSSMVGLGRTGLFTEQLRRGEEALAAASPHSVLGRTVWVASEPLSQGGADALRDLGVQMVLVPAEVAAAMGVSGDPFAIELGDGATLPGALISPLGAQLASPPTGRSASDAAVHLLVEAILERESGASPGLVLATGPDGVPDVDVTSAFVRYANSTPGISVVGASKLIGAVAEAGRVEIVTASDRPADDLAGRAAEIEVIRPSAEAVASMLVDPAPAARWNGDFVRLLASTLDDEQAASRLADIDADIDGYLTAVVPPERFTFRITGTSSKLALGIINNSDQVLNVVVRVASPKLETDDLPTQLVPGENSVRVPVTARSNGTFSVEVTVLTLTDMELARPVVLKADVTRLSGVSRVVTIGALLALASWWYSHFRKRRRLQRADAGPAMRLEPGPTLSPDAAESRGPE